MRVEALCEFMEGQAKKWQPLTAPVLREKMAHLSVITLSSQPGSGGGDLAVRVAEKMGFDLFNRELLEVVAKSAEVTPSTLEHLEKERFSGVQDFIASLLDGQYLWPGVYLEHLTNMVRAISNRGYGVIVGRGANCILPSEERLSVRIVSSMDRRIAYVVEKYDVSAAEAQKRITHRESRRAAFIKKSFEKDIDDSGIYDLVLNVDTLGADVAVNVICSTWFEKFFHS